MRLCNTCRKTVSDEHALSCAAFGCDARFNVHKDQQAALRAMPPRPPKNQTPPHPAVDWKDLWHPPDDEGA